MKVKENNVLTIIIGIALIITIFGVILSTGYLVFRINDLSKEVETLKKGTTPTPSGEEEQPSGYDTSAFKEILGKDVVKESKNKTIVVLVARQTCGYCAIFAPTITEISEEYDFQVRYVDLEKIVDIYSPNWDVIDQESYDTLVNLKAVAGFETFMDEFGATPMTVVIKDGKITGGIIGAYPKENVVEALKDAGAI
jgi:thiol-disulfide isomerase/thioredoxin